MLASGCDVAAAPMNLGQLQCQHKGMPTTSVGIPAASTDCTCWEGGQEQQLGPQHWAAHSSNSSLVDPTPSLSTAAQHVQLAHTGSAVETKSFSFHF